VDKYYLLIDERDKIGIDNYGGFSISFNLNTNTSKFNAFREKINTIIDRLNDLHEENKSLKSELQETLQFKLNIMEIVNKNPK
jgi:hypothetical protein